jgi:hypothetical protein
MVDLSFGLVRQWLGLNIFETPTVTPPIRMHRRLRERLRRAVR